MDAGHDLSYLCCSGTMGLKGDLTAGEIVEQLVHAQRVTAIKNVVYMVSWSLVKRTLRCISCCFVMTCSAPDALDKLCC